MIVIDSKIDAFVYFTIRIILIALQCQLLLHCYKPKPLETFILRDPKTRKISKSAFRDIKEGTVWEHAVKGIVSNNLSIYTLLPKERVLDIFFIFIMLLIR